MCGVAFNFRAERRQNTLSMYPLRDTEQGNDEDKKCVELIEVRRVE
jgi:hypothetical protein